MVIVFAGVLTLLLFGLQRILYRRFWQQGVKVLLRFEKSMVQAGESVILSEIVENGKWLPLSSLKVKFQCSRNLRFSDDGSSSVTDKFYRNDLFSIMPYRRITRSHQISCPKRGYYGIEGIDLVAADLFFSQELMGSMSSDASLYVIPRAVSQPELEMAMRRINGELAARRYELEDPFTYRGIREYEPFDDQKAINWKATAKTGELKVNIREHTAVNGVRIFMNLTDNSILRREELLELCISICSGISGELLAQGTHIAIYANGTDSISGQQLCLENLADKGSMDTVYKALARLKLDGKMEDFRECFQEKLFEDKEGLYTIFVSADRHQDQQEFLISYGARRDDFLWICPVKKREEQEVQAALTNKTIFVLEESSETVF